ncbi:MAG: LysR family transcriptional regulator, partial [Pseudomonadota bacterium]|nr:LysR family transcriptional regulator [Pseudomonadota bacterium]
KVALELPSSEAVRAAVEAGAGVAAISELVVESGLRTGTLAAAKVSLPVRPFNAVRHRERYRSKAAQAFLDLLAEDARPVLVADAV